MKLLLDENCQNLKPYLLELGWEVDTVKEALKTLESSNSINDDQILSYALQNKTIIITKDNGLKKRCQIFYVPFIDLGSPEQEATLADRKLKEMQAWKEFL
jgi:predicted nuclease of predicted toxin-antitoxin system